MNKIDQLKLSNDISMKIAKYDFPVNGRTVITISVEDNKAVYIDVKNLKTKATKKED